MLGWGRVLAVEGSFVDGVDAKHRDARPGDLRRPEQTTTATHLIHASVHVGVHRTHTHTHAHQIPNTPPGTPITHACICSSRTHRPWGLHCIRSRDFLVRILNLLLNPVLGPNEHERQHAGNVPMWTSWPPWGCS